MLTITVPRSDVTSDEVADALRQSLGSQYKVLPGTGVNRNPVGGPRPDHPDTIVVGTGSTRLFRAPRRAQKALIRGAALLRRASM
ncbi:MAG: hypothetical protein M3065_06620 [Actinomycetota bacterium]|nr:hypothetical protein [Actinomycetota bacterium]